MPVTVEAPQTIVTPPHKLWTREECLLLEQTGLLNLEQYELIQGELFEKMARNPPHSRALRIVIQWLEDVFGRNYVMPETAIDLRPEDSPTSEPEPDACVLTLPYLELAPSARARPSQIRLLVEVSSSRLAFDLTTKALLYARSGISEYWVVDLESRRLVVHCEAVEGRYRRVTGYREDESVSSLAAPERRVAVSEFFR